MSFSRGGEYTGKEGWMEGDRVRGKHVLSRRSCCRGGNGNTLDSVFVIQVSEGLDNRHT